GTASTWERRRRLSTIREFCSASRWSNLYDHIFLLLLDTADRQRTFVHLRSFSFGHHRRLHFKHNRTDYRLDAIDALFDVSDAFRESERRISQSLRPIL